MRGNDEGSSTSTDSFLSVCWDDQNLITDVRSSTKGVTSPLDVVKGTVV